MTPPYDRSGRTAVTALLLCLAAALPARAQDNTMSEPPKDYQDFFGLGTKQLKIWGGLDVEESFDSNVGLTSSNEDSDSVTSLIPSLHLRWDHSDDCFQIDYVGRDRFYSDHDEFNGMEHFLDTLAKVTAGKLELQLYDHYSSRKDPFNVALIPDRLDVTQNDAGLVVGLDLEHIDLEIAAMQRQFRIHDGPLKMFDHDRLEYSVLVAYDLMPKTQVLVEYGMSKTEYKDDTLLNNWDAMRIVGGLRNTPSEKTRVVAKAGWVSVDSDEGALIPSDDASGLYLSAAVDWDVVPEGTLKFTGLRQPVESIYTGVTMSTRFTIDYDHHFTEKFTGLGGIGYETTSEVSGGIDDRTLTTVHAGARWTPALHFALRAMVEYRAKMSDTSAFEFSDFRGTIGAGVDF